MESLELEKIMNRIIEWVKVCDTKTSIMLSALSVLLTICSTSEIIVNKIYDLVLRLFDKHYYLYSGINVIGILALLFLITSCFFALGSGYCFIKVLYAKKDENQFNDNHFTNSLIHFHHISSLKYEEFLKDMKEYSNDNKTNDLLSQIHINAIRCNEKFDNYNAGIKYFAVTLVLGLVTFILFSIYYILY